MIYFLLFDSSHILSSKTKFAKKSTVDFFDCSFVETMKDNSYPFIHKSIHFQSRSMPTKVLEVITTYFHPMNFLSDEVELIMLSKTSNRIHTC